MKLWLSVDSKGVLRGVLRGVLTQHSPRRGVLSYAAFPPRRLSKLPAPSIPTGHSHNPLCAVLRSRRFDKKSRREPFLQFFKSLFQPSVKPPSMVSLEVREWP